MFLKFNDYLSYLEEKIEGSPTRKRSEAVQQVKKDFGVALSSVYRMSSEDGYFVFVDYLNKESRILRTSGLCDSTQ